MNGLSDIKARFESGYLGYTQSKQFNDMRRLIKRVERLETALELIVDNPNATEMYEESERIARTALAEEDGE